MLFSEVTSCTDNKSLDRCTNAFTTSLLIPHTRRLFQRTFWSIRELHPNTTIHCSLDQINRIRIPQCTGKSHTVSYTPSVPSDTSTSPIDVLYDGCGEVSSGHAYRQCLGHEELEPNHPSCRSISKYEHGHAEFEVDVEWTHVF